MMSMREGKERRKEEKAGIRKQNLLDTEFYKGTFTCYCNVRKL